MRGIYTAKKRNKRQLFYTSLLQIVLTKTADVFGAQLPLGPHWVRIQEIAFKLKSICIRLQIAQQGVKTDISD